MAILLYHGTLARHAESIQQNGIDLRMSKARVDFAPGFYTTPLEAFARKTAHLRTRQNNLVGKSNDKAAVIVLECDLAALEKLSIKRFEQADRCWGRFILANRTTNEFVHLNYEHNRDRRYDCVCGPTADGTRLAALVARINRDGLLMNDFDLEDIRPANDSHWGEQWSLHTQKALACVRVIDMIYCD